jgi:hypothetical protein
MVEMAMNHNYARLWFRAAVIPAHSLRVVNPGTSRTKLLPALKGSGTLGPVMAGPLRAQFKNGRYHVTAHGNNRQRMFKTSGEENQMWNVEM